MIVAGGRGVTVSHLFRANSSPWIAELLRFISARISCRNERC